MGKILEKDTMLNTISNSHIYQFTSSAGPDASLSQCILNQRKKSEEAESIGALKRGTHIEVKIKQRSLLAKIVESQIIEESEDVQSNLSMPEKENVSFKYYVSFAEMNRRMDQWIAQNEICQVFHDEQVPKKMDAIQGTWSSHSNESLMKS